MKSVKSTDPRKPAIVAALKAKSGGSKVTLLTERNGVFTAQCMASAPGRKYRQLGEFQVTAAEVWGEP